MADANDGTRSDKTTTGSRQRVEWSGQDEYWRDNYGSRPYTHADRAYEYYQPAYKYGHESAFFYGYRPWDQEVEHDLERGWDTARGDSNCTWPEVKDAVHDAYDRARTESVAA